MVIAYELGVKQTPDYRYINSGDFGVCTFQLPPGQELNLNQQTGWAKCFHSIAETDSPEGQDRLVNILERLGGHTFRMSLVVHGSFHPENPEPHVRSLHSKIAKYECILKKTWQSPLGAPANQQGVNYACLISQAKDGLTIRSRIKFEQLVEDWMSSSIHDAQRSLLLGDANWEFWPSEAYHTINKYSNVLIQIPNKFKRKKPVLCHVPEGNAFQLIRNPTEARPWELR